MHKPVSLIQVYLFSLIIIIIVIFPLLGYLWIKHEITGFQTKSIELKQEYIESGKETMKDEVDNAAAYIRYIRSKSEENLRLKVRSKTLYGFEFVSGMYEANKGRMSLFEMKNLAHDVLSSVIWDDGLGYYFVEDMLGYEIINPINPNLERKNIIKTARSNPEGGFISYLWNNPNFPEKLVAKISYVKFFEPFGWIIGTGKYLEEEEVFMKGGTLDSLEKFYFTESGVFFGGDWSGDSLFESSSGISIFKALADSNSELYKKFIAVSRNGSGFIEIFLSDLTSENTPSNKFISYISGIPEWEMYIGSVIDLGKIDKSISLEQADLNVRIKQIIVRIIIYIFIFALFSFSFAVFTYGRVKNNLRLFKEFFERAAHDLTLIDTTKLFFRESVILANSANYMVTERSKVLGKLLESEKRVFQIIEAANIPMAAGSNGNAEILNRSYRETFGYTLKDIPTIESMWELAFPDLLYREKVREEWYGAVKEYSSGNKSFKKLYCTVRCKNGEFKEVEIDFSPIGNGGLILFRDLTEDNKRDAKNALLEKKLLRAQKMEAIGLMAGGVAHDLNNILSGIVGYPDLILMSLDKDSEIIPHVKAIKRSGLRAADVVADLLTIAKGVASTKKICNLNKIINQYFNSPEYEKLKPQMESIVVIENLDEHLLNISCSAIHIKKCVMNLVMNAVEAMEKTGELTISTKNQYVDTTYSMGQYMEKGEYAVLSVKDSGHGIQEEDRERIFDPFYTKKVMGMSGTGLGLSVVWNTVQDHHGGIIVTSSANGTVFDLYFPVDRTILVEDSMVEEEIDIQGNGESVLIIDDESLQQEIASGMLTYLGYETHFVGSGKEAIEWLKTNPVDILLLDMIMPSGLNGHQTYKEIVKIYPNQKAIIASGYSQNTDVESTLKLGAGRFIKKPYTMQHLGKAMKHELIKN